MLVVSPGVNSYPIDVVHAFGSIWVANHRLDTVTRLDPETLEQIASIKTGPGPGWFAVTDSAIWVTNQNWLGVTHIDPVTNAGTSLIGPAPCSAPALDPDGVTLWVNSCDNAKMFHLNTRERRWSSNGIAADGLDAPITVGRDIYASGPDGLVRFDRGTQMFVPVGGESVVAIAYDGETIWATDESEVVRVRPSDGHALATIDISGATTVGFDGTSAWVAASNKVVAVDAASNEVVQTVMVGRAPLKVVARDGTVWVSDPEADRVFRFEPE